MSDTFIPPNLLETISYKLLEQKHRPGLYVVATPIGNMFDITLRAIHILRVSDCVFAEDTRQAKKIFNFYGITRPLVSCHEHNEISDSVLSMIKNNGIYALISDAGTPLISDPGFRLVNWCISNKIDVFPMPGACSFVAALCASGLPTSSFSFHGFPPTKSQARKGFLTSLKDLSSTLVFFESPNRLLATLTEMKNVFGIRYCCICREITKIFEEFRRGSIDEIIEYFSDHRPKGEFVILVSGETEEKNEEKNEEKILYELRSLLRGGQLGDAVRKICKKYHVSKNVIYQKALKIREEQ